MAIGTLAAIGLGAAGVGSFLSSKSNKKAATYAADTSYQTAALNNALAQNIYGQNKEALTPYMNVGNQASNTLNSLLGYHDAEAGQSAFRSWLRNSDYAFQFDEGENRLNSGYAGAGTLQSGGAMKELERFRQNLQAGYRGQFMNALANQQGVGLAGASALAGVGQNYVNTVNANNTNAGDAAANAALLKGQNNPLANAIGLLGGGVFGMAR